MFATKTLRHKRYIYYSFFVTWCLSGGMEKVYPNSNEQFLESVLWNIRGRNQYPDTLWICVSIFWQNVNSQTKKERFCTDGDEPDKLYTRFHKKNTAHLHVL